MVLLDQGLQFGGDSANDLVDLLAVLEQEKGGHGPDAVLLGDRGLLVDVNLEVVDVWVLLGPLSDLGGDGLARTAPGGVEVYEDDLMVGQGRFEPLGAGDFVNSHVCGGAAEASYGCFLCARTRSLRESAGEGGCCCSCGSGCSEDGGGGSCSGGDQ